MAYRAIDIPKLLETFDYVEEAAREFNGFTMRGGLLRDAETHKYIFQEV